MYWLEVKKKILSRGPSIKSSLLTVVRNTKYFIPHYITCQVLDVYS